MRHQSDTLPKPSGQTRSQDLRELSTHIHLMELMLCLQHTIEEYVTQLKTRHLQQDAVLEAQRHRQSVRKQEATLVHLMCQAVHLLQSESLRRLGLPQPGPSFTSSGDVGGGPQAQSPRLPDQLGHQPSDLEAAFISCDLSNRGIDISALYQAHFQPYMTYQGDKYHEDKNPLVRAGGGSCAKYLLSCLLLCPVK